MSADILSGDEREREFRREEAKKYLESIEELDNNFFPALAYELEHDPINFDLRAKEIIASNSSSLANFKGAHNFIIETEMGRKMAGHELGNLASVIVGYLGIFLSNPEFCKRDVARSIIKSWDRYKVAVGDILLRMVNSNEIPQANQTGIKLQALNSVIKYFSDKEIDALKTEAEFEEDSKYKDLKDKQINLVGGVQWDNLFKELGDRQVAGNVDFVGNFLLNALRNAMKDKTGAENIYLKVEINGDELVIRVEDDGSGIPVKNLTPGKKIVDQETGKEKSLFILDPGVSATGSSGIGLSNLHTRLASVGGKLFIATRDKSMSSDEQPTRYQYGANLEEAQAVRFDKSNHGTVFEIRLPITKKVT